MLRIILEFKKRYDLTKNMHALDTATWQVSFKTSII